MLITQLKDKEAIESVLRGKVFLINCHGCKEVRFPVAEAEALCKELAGADRLAGVITTDYICNVENLTRRLEKHAAEIAAADTILVLSCGVGVQTVADMFADKRVCAGCDTLPMPGFQGVTPLEYDCDQCGECYLNKCECDSNMECGWERIYQRLKMLGRLDLIQSPVQVRNFATDLEVSK